jgi:hypothetical protein
MEMQMDSNLKAPGVVTRAIVLIVISTFLLGLIKATLDWTRLTSLSGTVFTATVLSCTLAFNAFLVWKIYQGRNWARITFLAFFSLGLLPWVFIVRAEFHRSIGLWSISMIQAAIQAYAMVLIFTSPGKEWFRPKQVQS